MKTENKTSRILGGAFLLQAVTSIVSGAVLWKPMVVDGDIAQTMINIAAQPLRARADILGEVITACGIIFLGAVLFTTLRRLNENLALTGFGLYILEAVLLVVSRIDTFKLLQISQEYVLGGNPADLLAMGRLALESASYGYNLAMMGFCTGGLLFYYLLDRARIVPRALSLWGLIAAVPVTAATVLALVGVEVPFAVYLPYVPFEFVIGIWILIKGVAIEPDSGDDRLKKATDTIGYA